MKLLNDYVSTIQIRHKSTIYQPTDFENCLLLQKDLNVAKDIDIRNQDKALPDNFVNDVRSIIEQGRRQAYAAVGQAAIATYWNVGRRIVEEEQEGKARAEYGSQLIPMLAEQLTQEYGNGYGRRNLAYYRQLYLMFSDWEILHELVQNLTWTHLRRILSVSNPQAQIWYLKTASENRWSTTELDRNISTQYFERRLAAQLPAKVEDLPQTTDRDPLEYIKNPMVAEFMGFHRDTIYSETVCGMAEFGWNHKTFLN